MHFKKGSIEGNICREKQRDIEVTKERGIRGEKGDETVVSNMASI